MSKQSIVVIVGALVLFAVGVVGALALTGRGGGTTNAHTMPSGPSMTGPAMSGSAHAMRDGRTMTGEMTGTAP